MTFIATDDGDPPLSVSQPLLITILPLPTVLALLVELKRVVFDTVELAITQRRYNKRLVHVDKFINKGHWSSAEKVWLKFITALQHDSNKGLLDAADSQMLTDQTLDLIQRIRER